MVAQRQPGSVSVRGLSERVAALEARQRGGSSWLTIIQRAGQSEEQATAAYEATHGPIGEANRVLRIVIRKPGCVHA